MGRIYLLLEGKLTGSNKPASVVNLETDLLSTCYM